MSGDPKLMALVYEELAGPAATYLRRLGRGEHTLSIADLVDGAYVRLAGRNGFQWKDKARFLNIAAQMMRRILVNRARIEQSWDLVALDDALIDLASLDPRQARIFELRFFAGLTSEEIVEALDISVPLEDADGSLAPSPQHSNFYSKMGPALEQNE